MMLVSAFGLDVQITLGRVGEGLEEMQEHFRRHVADLLPLEGRIPNQPGPSAKVDGNLREAVVHGQAKAIPFNTAFVIQCFQKSFAERERCIFNSMVLVDVKVALHLDADIDIAVARQLIQHVVEEAQPGVNGRVAVTIEVDVYQNVGFLRGSLYHSFAHRLQQERADLFPASGNKRAPRCKALLFQLLLQAAVVDQNGLWRSGCGPESHR